MVKIFFAAVTTKIVATAILSLATLNVNSLRVLAQEPDLSRQNSSQAGCLSGYPNGTYQGDRSVTRNEFAAGMNACLEGIDQRLRSDREQQATREDFQILIERQRQLNEQLRELNGRVGNPSPAKSSDDSSL